MLGCRSKNSELTPFDPDIEKTFKRELKKLKEIKNPSFKMAETEERTLKDLFAPITTNPPSCIVLPATTANHFELKPHIIQLLPTFHGFETEDPYMHVKEFLEICATFRFQNFSEDSVRLRLFPFSLKEKAKAWLNYLPSQSITTWDMLVTKFLSKFFPMSKTNALRRKISDLKI